MEVPWKFMEIPWKLHGTSMELPWKSIEAWEAKTLMNCMVFELPRALHEVPMYFHGSAWKLMEVHGDYSEVEAAVARADSDMEEDEGEEA